MTSLPGDPFVRRTLLKRLSVRRNGAIRRICGAERRSKSSVIRPFGNDVFVCLPTVSGKSRILPAVFDALRGTDASIVVVVSPLIALMKDQVPQASLER